MADILNIGSSALLASRTALDVAGHNIANANTPGYSRQRVELAARLAGVSAIGFAGSGVQINSVQRLDDRFLFAREISGTASLSRIETFHAIAASTDTLLSDRSTGLSGTLTGFFDSLASLAANPASSATRQAVLSAADTLAGRFRDLQQGLNASEQAINDQLSQTVSEVNGYGEAIAQLNRRIAETLGSSRGQPPNDLLDQREQLLRQLAEKVSVTSVPQDDGSLNVFVANGQSLVVGSQASSLATARNEFNPQRLEITSAASAGGAVISRQLGGGKLGGLLDARRELLDPAREKLGRLAIAISEAVNAQQAQGVDQAGNFGAPLFASLAGAASASVNNAGSAAVSVGFADSRQLKGRQYLLGFDGSSWSLKDSQSGAAIAFTGTGTAADPLLAEGLSLTLSGTAAAGDRFSIQPGLGAAGQLRVALDEASGLAAAAPIRAAAVLGNQGSGSVSSGEVLDVANPGLRTPVRIEFTSASSYRINGSGSYAYSAGSAISVNGWSVNISGVPATGDGFDITPTAANSGDARNAQRLTGLVNQALLDGGFNSITGAHAQLVAQVGAQTQQAAVRLDSQTAISQQTGQAREALSGVSLDEEAADLLRYQQAYQAAAQVIATASTVFDTLLGAIRR